MRRILVAGASRGIGAAVARHYETGGDTVISLSRSESASGQWIPCDLSKAQDINRVSEVVGTDALDALVYAGGVWEAGAFTEAYDFRKSTTAEILNVLAVNLTGPILLTQALLPALGKSEMGRAVFIGSTSGLDNAATPEVANTASKFGLRGAAQAMGAAIGGLGVPVTVINPGNVATEEVLEDIRTGAFRPQTPIPMSDLLATIDFALSLSSASVADEINLVQTRP